MTEEEVNAIWERRNLAYFDRHQRKLAEERQQQGLSGCDDDSVDHHSSSSDSSASFQEQLGAEAAPSVQQRGQQRHQLTRPAGFVCAADSPQWRAFTSRNIFGDYDPERASREPAYHNAWISCERLVNITDQVLLPEISSQRIHVSLPYWSSEDLRWHKRDMQRKLPGGSSSFLRSGLLNNNTT
jgi:hypothetical protein